MSVSKHKLSPLICVTLKECITLLDKIFLLHYVQLINMLIDSGSSNEYTYKKLELYFETNILIVLLPSFQKMNLKLFLAVVGESSCWSLRSQD